MQRDHAVHQAAAHGRQTPSGAYQSVRRRASGRRTRQPRHSATVSPRFLARKRAKNFICLTVWGLQPYYDWDPGIAQRAEYFKNRLVSIRQTPSGWRLRDSSPRSAPPLAKKRADLSGHTGSFRNVRGSESRTGHGSARPCGSTEDRKGRIQHISAPSGVNSFGFR